MQTNVTPQHIQHIIIWTSIMAYITKWIRNGRVWHMCEFDVSHWIWNVSCWADCCHTWCGHAHYVNIMCESHLVPLISPRFMQQTFPKAICPLAWHWCATAGHIRAHVEKNVDYNNPQATCCQSLSPSGQWLLTLYWIILWDWLQCLMCSWWE